MAKRSSKTLDLSPLNVEQQPVVTCPAKSHQKEPLLLKFRRARNQFLPIQSANTEPKACQLSTRRLEGRCRYTNISALACAAPGEKDVVSIVSVVPGAEGGEELHSLAERGLERIFSHLRHHGTHARLCAVAVVDVEVQDRNLAYACITAEVRWQEWDVGGAVGGWEDVDGIRGKLGY